MLHNYFYKGLPVLKRWHRVCKQSPNKIEFYLQAQKSTVMSNKIVPDTFKSTKGISIIKRVKQKRYHDLGCYIQWVLDSRLIFIISKSLLCKLFTQSDFWKGMVTYAPHLQEFSFNTGLLQNVSAFFMHRVLSLYQFHVMVNFALFFANLCFALLYFSYSILCLFENILQVSFLAFILIVSSACLIIDYKQCFDSCLLLTTDMCM